MDEGGIKRNKRSREKAEVKKGGGYGRTEAMVFNTSLQATGYKAAFDSCN